MANAFKNYTARSVGTGLNTVHTAPAGTTTVIGMTVTNRTASAIKVAVTLHDGVADTYLIGGPTVATMGADIPVGGALCVIGGDQKLVLEATNLLKVESSAASSVDVIISCLEIT